MGRESRISTGGGTLLLLLFSAATPLAARDVLVLGGEDRYSLIGRLELLEDPSHTLTLANVMAPPYAARFTASRATNLGVSASAWWIRFRLRHDPADPRRWFLRYDHSLVDELSVYLPRDGGHHKVETGVLRPYTSRDVPHRRFVFAVPAPPAGGEQTIYLRIRSRTTIPLVLAVWDVTALAAEDHGASLRLGIFYGALLVLLIYSVVFYAAARQTSLLFLAGYLIASLVIYLCHDGTLFVFWPKHWVAHPGMAPIAACVAMSCQMLFTRSFLHTHRRLPRFDRVILGCIAFLIVLAVLFPFYFTALLKPYFLAQIVIPLLVLAAGVVVYRQGHRPALYFLASWLTLTVALACSVAMRLGWLPAIPELFSGLRVFYVVQCVLLVMAVAAEVRAVRREYGEAQGARLAERARALQRKEELNATLRQARLRLEARNTELEAFYYTIWHDIRNPLVTIKGFLGLLEHDIQTQNAIAQLRDLTRIRSAAETLDHLFRELTGLSLLRQRLQTTEEVALAEVVEKAVGSLTDTLVARGLAVEVADDLPQLNGDAARLTELFLILLSNAVEHMGEASAPRIRIAAARRAGTDGHDESVVSFADNGRGIAPRYHEKVFGLFERLDVTHAGVGMGLARARYIVEAHGGRIWVESEGAGDGSTFRFTLPG